jgi:hypothetical protein
MTIGEERTMAMEIHPPKKIPTGIEGFEHLTLGGLPERSIRGQSSTFHTLTLILPGVDDGVHMDQAFA